MVCVFHGVQRTDGVLGRYCLLERDESAFADGTGRPDDRFETIFAVTYAHVLRMQWPAWNMLAGMALLLAGVTLSLKVFQAAKAKRGEIVV